MERQILDGFPGIGCAWRDAAGNGENGLPIPGKFPPVPDLAASGVEGLADAKMTAAKEEA